MNRYMGSLLLLFAVSLCFIATVAQPPLPGGADEEALNPVDPGSKAFRGRLIFNCSKFFRELDGTCTNDRNGIAKLYGSTGRPQFSYFFNRPNSDARGRGLLSPRTISNILSKQTRDIFDERRVSEIAVFFGQFLDHSLVATPLNEEESFPISVGPRDSQAREVALQFGNVSILPFKRSQRVRVKERDNNERASNSLSSAVDLTNVYGPTKKRLNFLRTGIDGKLATSMDEKNLLPKNGRRLNNAPDIGPEFFLAGDHRANEHPILTSLHTLFMREHNRIADEIKEAFPHLKEEERFNYIKKINEAQFQRIVYEEWFPAITGRNVPPYEGYKRRVDPTVSLLFTTAGFRVGHTMVGSSVKRQGPGNEILPSLDLTDMFFHVVDAIENGGIDEFIRGAMNSPAQKVDLLVHDALRNQLFENITREGTNFDLVALNLQRGRDHALPSFNAVRRRLGYPKAVQFREISKNMGVQARLQTAYNSAGRVEAFPGLMAEDHAEGSSFGPTLLSLWIWEFSRIRNGDRLYYKRRHTWPKDLRKLPRVRRLLKKPSFQVFRQIILDNTDITSAELPKRLFFADP